MKPIFFLKKIANVQGKAKEKEEGKQRAQMARFEVSRVSQIYSYQRWKKNSWSRFQLFMWFSFLGEHLTSINVMAYYK